MYSSVIPCLFSKACIGLRILNTSSAFWMTEKVESNTQHSRGEWRIWHVLVVERLILVLVSLKWPPTEQYLLGHCRAQEASKQMWTPVVPTSQGICFWTCFILRYYMQVAWNYAGRMVEAETLDCFDSEKNLLLTSPKKLLRHESDMLRFLLCCEPNLLQQGRFCGFMWPRWFKQKKWEMFLFGFGCGNEPRELRSLHEFYIAAMRQDLPSKMRHSLKPWGCIFGVILLSFGLAGRCSTFSRMRLFHKSLSSCQRFPSWVYVCSIQCTPRFAKNDSTGHV